MTDSKVLQALLDGQNDIKENLKSVEKRVNEVEKNLESRIDNLGMDLANLADDAPTRNEFEILEKKVEKLEKQGVPA